MAMAVFAQQDPMTSGEFINMAGERYYAIHHVDEMNPFFISLVSDSDHWLFVSSTGGLTAGRVSPETALFPYVPVDRIHDSALHTGPKTMFNIVKSSEFCQWQPFNKDFNRQYKTVQNLYKNTLGDKLCFEEINQDLQLAFRYTWKTTEEYGFSRDCEIVNLSDEPVSIDLLDGLQNILPAGTPRLTQTVSSNLVDAYKWTELDLNSGLAMFTVYSGITDRAAPSESLKANTVFSIGFKSPKILLSSDQLENFAKGKPLSTEHHKRGVRGAYFVNSELTLQPKCRQTWQLVANVEQSQSQIINLMADLRDKGDLSHSIAKSISAGSNQLLKIVAATDGLQLSNEENVSVHHYANTLFNNLRGGVFENKHSISTEDFITTLKLFNQGLYEKHVVDLQRLPNTIELSQFNRAITKQGDPQLQRLANEYLPISFGRRHGDPSRPWNQFEIKLKGDDGHPLLSYQGNWRDVFQNWEALTFSYPEFIENVISKFVNASTVDGYNPYRITKQGIDWEIEEPDDPWSFIGYWGDHQIIYLQKMLELSHKYHPERLNQRLRQDVFSYANVPYRIKAFETILNDAKNTVVFDEYAAQVIDKRVQEIGSDGKLILDENGEVYQVNLLEKLLVPLLCKLGNLVVDGGIWLNTQRPEWNDANNAIVGQGLSVVTLNYLRRYVCFFQDLIEKEQRGVNVSYEVVLWLHESLKILSSLSPKLNGVTISSSLRFKVLEGLGKASSRYRHAVYQNQRFSHKIECNIEKVKAFLSCSLVVIEHSIKTSQSNDGLYHSYNLLELSTGTAKVRNLYPMLEGQVAALSSGAMSTEQVIDVINQLFESDIYRPDQKTFMLYPDRIQTPFLQKNVISESLITGSTVLGEMLNLKDEHIVLKDANGCYRFNPSLKNSSDLLIQLDKVKQAYDKLDGQEVSIIESIYEEVFNHSAFTGRSGGMFGFEGLGCIYWHMVSKLLLAIKENYDLSVTKGVDAEAQKTLAELYYRVREGIGFNKTPTEYGAFPCDPYSHTPKHAGAQQPGMTGQVKEEILTRFGELGVKVVAGKVNFDPRMLRQKEFLQESQNFRYLDVNGNWQQTLLPENSLAFTWCQVPIIYELSAENPQLTLTLSDGRIIRDEKLSLDSEFSHAVFSHNGIINQVHITVNLTQLCNVN
ncbi:hypothetical protein [Paraglaciecola marina]|uniref:hypothetical protein n=1 Tax=Paraglaciecola marina TaxID=2500157 RepID=UPI001EF0436E|nr:hypothetical protein [Paraglaciecola marina]